MGLRRQLQREIRSLRARDMPRLIDALAAVAVPAERFLKSRATVCEQVVAYFDGAGVGSELAQWLASRNATADALTEDDLRGSHMVCRVFPSLERTVWSLADRHAYFASPDMTALIKSAADDLPQVGLTEADLPSPNGVAYLSDPDNPLVLLWCVASQWEDEPNGLFVQIATADGLRQHLGNTGEDPTALSVGGPGEPRMLPLPGLALSLSEPGSDAPPATRTLGGFIPVPSTEHALYPNWPDEQFVGLFLSFVHMLRQDSTDTDTDEHHTRSSNPNRRRASRPTLITYLRYRPRRADTQTGAGAREYAHRWMVRGHWRRQWYPSEGRHRPIWISTYIAGPADAPLKTGDKVTLF